MSKTTAVLYSESPRKNICQKVYHDVDADGKKYSVTRHEAIDPSKPVYRRFKKGNQ